MSKPFAERTHKASVTASRRGEKRTCTHPFREARRMAATFRAENPGIVRTGNLHLCARAWRPKM